MFEKEHCELPFVVLQESEEQKLFDLTVNLKFGDKPKIQKVTWNLQAFILEDYPTEVFLQRLDLLEGLMHVFRTSDDIVSCTQTILSFISQAKGLYKY